MFMIDEVPPSVPGPGDAGVDRRQSITQHEAGGDPERGPSAGLAARRRQFARRHVERFVGHFEGAPVHAQRLAGTQVAMDAQRLGRLDVLHPHEPARRVGADGNRRKIEGPEAAQGLRRNAVDMPQQAAHAAQRDPELVQLSSSLRVEALQRQ